MKKILLAVALIASFQFAGAQQIKTKTPNAAKAAVEAAKAVADNAKKATKPATWTKLGQAYLEAYSAPAGNGWLGATKAELQLLMGNIKPTSETQVTIDGVNYIKDVYGTYDYYFDEAGTLQIIDVTKPLFDDCLGLALDAFKNAAKLDPNGSKSEEISAGIASVVDKLADDAITAYKLGDFAASSKSFEASARASMVEPYNKFDGSYLYNAGFTALSGDDLSRAKSIFEECLSLGYEHEDGEVYAKLADIATREGNAAAAKSYLEKGFEKYNQSQGILIGLINYYITSGDSPETLFKLIDDAKKNEPTNASLYYVEGNAKKELGDEEGAIASYRKCAEINPQYIYGYIGEGQYLYDKAVELQEAAQIELDDAKYAELTKQFEETLRGCIEPFEKAYEACNIPDTKVGIAEYLKNVYYRFSDESEEYMNAYKKYDAIVKGE